MNSALSGFNVLSPGLLSLVQDLGRFGFHSMGLTNGGPMDPLAFRWANRLCENPTNTTAIEISIGGLRLEAAVDTSIAVTGADMPLMINGEEKELWRSHRVQQGDSLALGFAKTGCRCYLAVAGGFSISPSFSSTATVVRESVGGLKGGALERGDFLPCQPTTSKKQWLVLEQDRPQYTREVGLRVVPGYQHWAFSDYQQTVFYSGEYKVSGRSDRMGYCLEGARINASIDGVLSEGICHGAIQIPADGQPIVLLNDRQTMGGYPKIGSVISVDTALLAQLMPGANVFFQKITLEEAHNALELQQSCFDLAEPLDVS